MNFSLLSFFSWLTLASLNTAPPLADKQAVEAVIRQFVQGGDERNEALLQATLHPEHRVILSRFNQSTTTTILSREVYFNLVKAGKIGGQKRTLTFEQLDVSDHTAAAKVRLTSDTQRFTSYYLLVKDTDKWQIVSDMPVVEPRTK